ncbi:non-ribosomal peptide synthase domain TIGR01720/amino acid adenylation domain-containing protein [Goodfellowiella coeruleoviolacea]|uniref:Non-ribosomal peptide synthase domain TIGR01720/amino acid adenylation domain-containing protein n=2 Tax=Goodfellowiella coeruleoviolacea TaxID=334858 RepID=A0AAE3KDZ3_9PSEU|nr:non-ribosomal peptide synthase domain TIGR01720/amino acid adenylation domain-containing protein [Goodfellowiella coeruleoviolacea]
MVVQAGVAALLSRLGAGTDIPLGAPVAGRTDEALDELVGFFVNTLVLRTDVSGDPSFRELVARVREADLAAYAHQDVPFERLVDVLSPQRSLARHPLFQVMVVYRAGGGADVTLPGLDTTAVNTPVETARFDLTVVLSDHRDAEITGLLNYAVDLFDRGTVERFARWLTRLFDSAAAAPQRRVSELDLLDQTELDQLPHRRDTAPPPDLVTLPDLFDAQVARTPERTALVCQDTELSYAELAAGANRLAHRLIRAGAGPEQVVAIAVPRSAAMITAVLGVLKAGAAYLPIDPDHPDQRVSTVLAEAAPVAVVTVSALADRLPWPPGTRLVLLDADAGDPPPRTAPTDADRRAPLRPHNAAYLIYTSGSTGRPKGVVVTHEGVGKLLATQRQVLAADQHTRLLHFVSISFDLAFWQLMIPLVVGGVLVVAPEEVRLPGEPFVEYVRRHRVTVVNVPPSFAGMLPPDCPLPAGTVLAVGAERMPPELVTRFGARHRLINFYGPTEATVNATSWVHGPDWRPGPVPIGRPDPGVRAYVLDAFLRPVPVGVPGELYLGGVGLARGYHARHGLTAGRFVADPFGTPGARMYRTGDRARWRDTGELDFLGRVDDQVKVRGFRIELGEVEAAVAAQDGVAHAVAAVREDQPGVRRLVGYVVPADPAAAVDVAALRARVAQVLPDYMVPAAFVVLDRLPTTTTGKVDRAALPAPDLARPAGSRPPAGPREHLLARLFAEILGLPEVGAEDSFFELGGDSIISIQLTSRARAEGLRISPRQVFEGRTVARLAELAEDLTEPAEAEPAEAGVGLVAATPVLCRLAEDGPVPDRFGQSVLLRVPPTDVPVLTAALQALLDHHDLLRATVVGDGAGGWALRVRPPGAVPAGSVFTRVDLTGRAEAELPAALAAGSRAAFDALAPHDGELVRCVWFDRGAEEGRLLLVAHHLVVDGVSWRILRADLAAAWTACAAGRPAALPRVGTSFRTWARRLREHADTAARRAELDTWTGMLGDGGAALGQRDRDPVVDTVATMGQVSATLPAEFTTPLLTTVPAAFHAGVTDVLLAGLAIAVAAWRRDRGQPVAAPTVVELEGHGREEQVLPGVDLTRTVGWFTSVFPLRLDVSAAELTDALAGGPAAGAVLRRVKERLRAVPDNGVGYGLLRHLRPDTRAVLAGHPRPQLGFNYLGRPDVGGAVTGAWATAPEAAALGGALDPTMPVPHVVEVNALARSGPDGPELAARWSFAGKILTEDEVRELAEWWFRALRALVGHAGRTGAGGHSPADFPLVALDQADIDQLAATRPDLVDVWPQTPMQEQLFRLAEAGTTGRRVYTVQTVVDLAGDVDPARLRAAVGRLLRRQPSLRVSFTRTRSGTPVQVVHGDVPTPWREIDLTGHDDTEIGRVTAAERAQEVDPTTPGLLRFLLARTGPDRHRLVVTGHHLLLDGWSVPVLVRELLALHRGDERPEPASGYRNFLAWRARQDERAALRAWLAELSELDGPTLVAPSAAAVPPAVPAQLTTTLDERTGDRLTQLARQVGVTPNTVVQGVWATVLARHTGRRDVVFGAVVSGRPPELSDTAQTIGMLVNTVPVRVRLRPDEPFARTLTALRESWARTLDHQHLGLDRITAALGGQPLFDTLLVFENFPGHPGAGDAVDADGPRVVRLTGADNMHHPLTLWVTPGTRPHLRLAYRTELFDRDAAQRLLTETATLLSAVTPGQPARIDT